MAHKGDSVPFFVVGIARSGTTLLRVMLNACPGISIGPETNVLHHLLDGIDASSLDRWSDDPYAFDELALDSFEELHLARMRNGGNIRWGDKTPQYWRLIPRILHTWPEAQFVYCLRDGRDVVCSMRDRWGWRVHYSSRQWATGVETALDYAEKYSDNVHVVRYEDLVIDTRDTVADVLRFLGETWDDRVLEPAKAHHADYESDSSSATEPVFTTSVGRWQKNLSPLDKRVAMHFMRATLDRAGYLP